MHETHAVAVAYYRPCRFWNAWSRKAQSILTRCLLQSNCCFIWVMAINHQQETTRNAKHNWAIHGRWRWNETLIFVYSYCVVAFLFVCSMRLSRLCRFLIAIGAADLIRWEDLEQKRYAKTERNPENRLLILLLLFENLRFYFWFHINKFPSYVYKSERFRFCTKINRASPSIHP